MPTKPRAAASKRDLGDKYLTRADYRGSRGYWARVCGQGGYLEPRWFSVAAHGTWAAAKRAAKAHVQAVVTRHRLKPRPCGDRSPRPYTRCKRTPDGYSIGVNLSLPLSPMVCTTRRGRRTGAPATPPASRYSTPAASRCCATATGRRSSAPCAPADRVSASAGRCRHLRRWRRSPPSCASASGRTGSRRWRWGGALRSGAPDATGGVRVAMRR